MARVALVTGGDAGYWCGDQQGTEGGRLQGRGDLRRQ